MVYEYMATVLFNYESKNDLGHYRDYGGFSGIVSIPFKVPRIDNRHRYIESDYNKVKSYLTPWMIKEVSNIYQIMITAW